MEYRSGDDDNKPLFTWEAERKTAPLKRINVWFSSSKKDTAGNISSEFILINTLNDISVLCFSFKQCTNESHWFNFDKNEVLNEQSTPDAHPDGVSQPRRQSQCIQRAGKRSRLPEVIQTSMALQTPGTVKVRESERQQGRF